MPNRTIKPKRKAKAPDSVPRQRSVDVVPNNDLAHANLGLVLARTGGPEEALAHFSEALRIVETPDPRIGTGRGAPSPEYAALLHNELGLLLGMRARWKEASAHAMPLAASPSAPAVAYMML